MQSKSGRLVLTNCSFGATFVRSPIASEEVYHLPIKNALFSLFNFLLYTAPFVPCFSLPFSVFQFLFLSLLWHCCLYFSLSLFYTCYLSSSFYRLLMCNLITLSWWHCRVPGFTARMYRVDWFSGGMANLHSTGLCISSHAGLLL